MKNNACFIIAFSIVFISCGLMEPVVWDDSIPAEECAVITFHGGFSIRSYNQLDLRVQNNRYFFSLPSGRAEFSGELSYYAPYGAASQTVYRLENPVYVSFSFPLEAGKEYQFITTVVDSKDKWIWGINVYQQSVRDSYSKFKKENLITFIPFNPSVVTERP